MPPETVHLAVDMMSGDSGLRITVPAALRALSDHSHLFLHLAGDEASLKGAIEDWPLSVKERVAILHAPESIDMGEQPTAALKRDSASSMRIALDALAQSDVVGVVSAGNAGALMILARKLVGMLQETARPAFCSMFPTETGSSLMLDLGANVDCSAEQLCSFGVLGNALSCALYPGQTPRVALLSNGLEAGKGYPELKRAATLLSQSSGLNYVGYIEANGLHAGSADVVVCDGFVGNVALKAVEGTAQVARAKLAGLLKSDGNRYGLGGDSLLADFSAAMDPELHNGAFLLGLAGIVVKAHGGSSVEGFVASIAQALQCEHEKMIAGMTGQLRAGDSRRD